MDKNSKAYLSGEFEDLFRESEIKSMAAEDAVAYGESYQKYVDTMAAVDYAARDSFSKGMEKGLAKGMEKGREEGKEEERVKGIRFMLELGISAEIISQKYGITVEDVMRCADS